MNNLPPFPSQQPVQPTVLTDVDIPFGRLVVILLKTMIASIPALICFYIFLAIIGLIFMLVFGGLFAGLSSGLQHAMPNLPTTPH